ncbi:hypothetical protein M514_02995 [Trichuris suis]|uniref:Uncharacterized protein n=1 Tax=Trichuris suis TaxID=68888 RepID=A0A085NI26_9BILA|nr:hypothetical protein M513_02995 [Trichuris suis]KFD69122.1 hypothetical protein M514_02995 [Trichuris suis]
MEANKTMPLSEQWLSVLLNKKEFRKIGYHLGKFTFRKNEGKFKFKDISTHTSFSACCCSSVEELATTKEEKLRKD